MDILLILGGLLTKLTSKCFAVLNDELGSHLDLCMPISAEVDEGTWQDPTPIFQLPDATVAVFVHCSFIRSFLKSNPQTTLPTIKTLLRLFSHSSDGPKNQAEGRRIFVGRPLMHPLYQFVEQQTKCQHGLGTSILFRNPYY